MLTLAAKVGRCEFLRSSTEQNGKAESNIDQEQTLAMAKFCRKEAQDATRMRNMLLPNLTGE